MRVSTRTYASGNVEVRDEACFESDAAPTAVTSKNRQEPSLDDIQVLMQSMSERPDEVYDIFEQYKMTSGDCQDDVTEIISNSRPAKLFGGEGKREGSDEMREQPERDGTDTSNSGSSSSIRNSAKLIQIMKRLDITPFFDHMQVISKKAEREKAAATVSTVPTQEQEQQINELQLRLNRELHRSEVLENHSTQLYEDLVAERRAASAAKSANEECIKGYIEEIHTHKQKSIALSDEMNAFQAIHWEAKIDLDTEIAKRTAIEKSSEARELEHEEEIKRLKQAHELDLDRVAAKRVFLEVAQVAREKQLEHNTNALSEEIEYRDAMLEEDQVKMKSLKMLILELKKHLQLEKNKVSAVRASEAALKANFDSEAHKVQVLFEANSHLQSMMEAMDAKESALQRVQGQVVSLKNKLDKQEDLIAFVRRTLLTREMPSTETGKDDNKSVLSSSPRRSPPPCSATDIDEISLDDDHNAMLEESFSDLP